MSHLFSFVYLNKVFRLGRVVYPRQPLASKALVLEGGGVNHPSQPKIFVEILFE